jgi:hypothetical protein
MVELLCQAEVSLPGLGPLGIFGLVNTQASPYTRLHIHKSPFNIAVAYIIITCQNEPVIVVGVSLSIHEASNIVK